MKPTAQWKDKGLQVTQWPTSNGGYSYQISKRYKDKKTEERKDSKYYYKEDLERLVVLLQQALAQPVTTIDPTDDDIPF